MLDSMEHDEALRAVKALGSGEFAIENAVEDLRDEDRYEGWQEELRYFMFRYEEYLAAKKGQHFSNAEWTKIWQDTPAQSIEHITPQSKGYYYVHRLGNLVLLPPRLNSKLQDKSPAKKASAYEKTGLLIASELKRDLKGWKAASVNKREDRLIRWAKKEWAD